MYKRQAPQHAAADGAGVLGRLDVHGAVPHVKHLVGVQAERADHLVDPGGVGLDQAALLAGDAGELAGKIVREEDVYKRQRW